MISADELLKPISQENPCGEDLYYDPKFQGLDALLKGKPPDQFDPVGQPPDWKALHSECLELFERSKDLRVATMLAVAAVKLNGIPALREGLSLVKGLLQQYWEPVYPRLDPDDGNDPLYRMNIVAALSTPKGTFGDPMRFLERIGEAPLTNSMQLGRFGYADVLRSQTGEPPPEGQQPVTAAQIEAAFRDTPPEDLQSVHQMMGDCVGLVKEIDEFLTSTVGAGKAPDLELLVTELKQIQKQLATYTGDATAEAAQEGEAGQTAGGGAPAGKAISGEVQSRKDVVMMLDKICQYYSRNEPASPIPGLLRRAQRLAEMDFMQIIKELCPDAEGTIRTITGEKSES